MLAAMGLGSLSGAGANGSLGFSTMPYYQPGYGPTPIPAWAETGAIWAIRLAKWTTVAAMFLQTAGDDSAAYALDNYLTGVLMASSDDEAKANPQVVPGTVDFAGTPGPEDPCKDLIYNPQQLWGKTPAQIKQLLEQQGYKATIDAARSQNATKIVVEGYEGLAQILVHSGGGTHGGPYVKLSTTTAGRIKVIDPVTYKQTATDKTRTYVPYDKQCE